MRECVGGGTVLCVVAGLEMCQSMMARHGVTCSGSPMAGQDGDWAGSGMLWLLVLVPGPA